MKKEHMAIVAIAALVLLWLWSRSGSRSGGATLVPLGAVDPGTEQARLAAQSDAFAGLTQAFSALGLEQIRSRTEMALGETSFAIARMQAQADAARVAAALEGLKHQTTASLVAEKDRNKSERDRSIWDNAGDVGVAIVGALLGGGSGTSGYRGGYGGYGGYWM